MYTFTCAAPTDNTNPLKKIKSCQIYFDEGAPITLNAPFLSVDHLFKGPTSPEPKSYTVSATGVLDSNTFVKAEDVTISIAQDAFSCFCDSTQADYVSDGVNSISKSTSGTSRPFVYINHKVSFDALANIPKTHGICIDAGGVLKNSDGIKLDVGELTTGTKPVVDPFKSPAFIYNKGKIFIENNNSFVKPRNTDPSTEQTTAGYDLTLYAKDFIVNEKNIQAGSGGNIVDHTNGITQTGLTANTEFAIKNEFLKPYPALDLNPIVAQKGGNVTLGALLVSNYGTIGPDKSIGFTAIKGGNNNSIGELFTSGGNGGVASRSSMVQRSQTQSSNNDCSNFLEDKLFYTPEATVTKDVMIGYTLGNAVGGDGGDISITQFNTFENFGVVKAGEGGAARVWECNSTYADNIAIGGKGGKVTVSPNQGKEVTVSGYGVIDGSGGKIYLEPLLIQGSNSFRIVNASEAVIFGGDGAQIKLNNLAAGAISATGDIILAVGQGGIVDLRGNNAKIFNSTSGKVKIYADTVLLDTGVTLADLANVTVEKYPAQILFAVNLQGTGTIKGNANATLPLAVTVQNVGPSSDTYTLSLTNPNNWQITGLPSSLTVDGLKSQVITLQVTLPANAVGSLVNDIVIRAVSTANATATSEMKVRLIAESVQTSASCANPASYDIATSTVTLQKIDVPVLSPLDGKPTGEYAVFEAKVKQIPGVEDFQILPDSLKYLSSSTTLNPKNAQFEWSESMFSNGGKLSICVAVPSVVVINGMKIPSSTKNYQVTLRTLAVDQGFFHIEKITPAN